MKRFSIILMLAVALSGLAVLAAAVEQVDWPAGWDPFRAIFMINAGSQTAQEQNQAGATIEPVYGFTITDADGEVTEYTVHDEAVTFGPTTMFTTVEGATIIVIDPQ